MDKTPKILFDFFCPRPLNNSFRRGETPATAIDTVAGVGDRRLAASGSDSAGRRGRGRATDRKGGAVALIRARTRKSLSRVRFLAHRTLSRRRRMTESETHCGHRKHLRDLPIGLLVTDRAMEGWYHPSIA